MFLRLIICHLIYIDITMKDLAPITFPDIDGSSPLIIAGPCSAESEEQVISTAQALAAVGVRIFRAGIWKPRTKPGGFEGVGSIGLGWLQRVHNEMGMYTATEVATPQHIEEALSAGIDMLWIGARTSASPFAMQSIADALVGVDIPVLVKNPVNPDLELWIGAIERLYNAGLRRIAAVHRGFSSYETHIYRNEPQWHIPIELRRRLPSLPIIGDPSHIGGRRELIAPLSQEAMDMGFDGLIIESHISPDTALSDAQQQITPNMLCDILSKLVIRNTTMSTEVLSDLRRRIDTLDNELIDLLARRMHVSREIGMYKNETNMPVFQAQRYDEILNKRMAQASELQMSPSFIKSVLQAIHEESVRQQVEIINKK